MSLKTAMNALVQLEQSAVGDQAATPLLNVYRWWQPNIALPAVWHWLSPGETRQDSTCRIEDLIRIDIVIGVDPLRHAGQDMLALEDALEALRAPLDADLYGRIPLGGVAEADRKGIRSQVEQVGQLGVLCLVLPIEVRISSPLP